MHFDKLLINHRHFHPPLLRALEDSGFNINTEVNWTPQADDFQGVLAGFVWFYECLRSPYQVWQLRRRLNRFGIPLVAWNRDAPHYLNRQPWRLNLLNQFPLLDIYATHTLIDTKRQFADTTLYFPNAADTANYNPGRDPDAVLSGLRDSSSYEWDVSFFGGMNGQRYKEDQARHEFFAALGEKLTEKKISFRFQEAEGMSVEEQIAFIHMSRINLNFGARCEYLAPVASGLPERCYGIPATGGFLLSDKRTHARDDFSLGENWTEFDGLNDCVNQIEFWLTNFSAARSLAERSYKHVLQHHTYRNRAQTLVNALHAWHQGQRGLMKS